MKVQPPPIRKRDFYFLLIVLVLSVVLVSFFVDLPTLVAIAALAFAGITVYVSTASYSLMEQTLKHTTTDMKARVRPFISVSEVDVEPTDMTSKVFLALTNCTVRIQNTGTVPARNLYIDVSLIDADNSHVAKELQESLSFLAPNVQYPLEFSGITSEIQLKIYKGAMKLRVNMKYTGIGEDFETDQLFRIQKRIPELLGYRVIFKPDQPSTFS